MTDPARPQPRLARRARAKYNRASVSGENRSAPHIEGPIVMSRQNLAWLLGIVAVSVLGFVVSLGATARDTDLDYEHVRLFVDVLHEVRSRYVYKLTPERERKLVEDMLNGGLERLN